MMVMISPSILSSDFANLEREIGLIERGGAELVHIDVMDGHFVPNITIGIPVIKSLRKVTGLVLDVHLMITDPARYLPQFIEAGSDLVTFHLESQGDPKKMIETIHQMGAKAGIALKPGTPAQAAFPYLSMVDMVLVMTVEPGFGGQRFMPDVAKKVRAIRQMQVNPSLHIGVDGGINLDNVKSVIRDGADVIIAGSAVFNAKSRALAINALRRG